MSESKCDCDSMGGRFGAHHSECPAARKKRLAESDRAKLRDWLDQPGVWTERMGNLYRLVERISERHSKKAAALGWEQGWVARGNDWGVDDNPYGRQEVPQ